MAQNDQNESRQIITRLNELLEYVHHLGSLNQKPMFNVDEHKQLQIWEHQVKGKIGISHNIIDEEGLEVWLKIERLKRIPPPVLPAEISEWVTLSFEPECTPQIKDKILKTMKSSEVNSLLEQGLIQKTDVMDRIENDSINLELKDVVLRLANNDEVSEEFKKYINDKWTPWSEEEKPRRETIHIYDKVFSFQQTIEAHIEGQPIELIWGIGIARWDIEERKIDIPLIEKCVEIELNIDDSSILIRPRQLPPNIAVDAFIALENFGAENLMHFAKKHFAESSEHIEFTPYNRESYESILRQAVTFLSEKGVYWPDLNQDKENRQPNKISETLEVTDSWIIIARPKSSSSFNQDIERFKDKLEDIEVNNIPETVKRLVTKHSNSKPIQSNEDIFSFDGLAGGNYHTEETTELFFPKPFNKAQKDIIEKLDENEGVVVQGPPGTGKTHTIANIISHYLATGKSVLVTSKGESALSVLQDQIPEDIRKLTISMLTNERQGMKQFESAIHLLANIFAQGNLIGLKKEAAIKEQQIDKLKEEIKYIDRQFEEWGLKQLKPVDRSISGADKDITAMELAQQVVKHGNLHQWLPDKLGSSEKYAPKFSDSDMGEIRNARRKLGIDLAYVEKILPLLNDLPDTANIASIHSDLVNLAELASKRLINDIPPMSFSESKAIERAESLILPLKELLNIQNQCSEDKWLKFMFNAWDQSASDQIVDLYESLFSELEQLVKSREIFIKIAIDIREHSVYENEMQMVFERLIADKKAFGIFSLGAKEIKNLVDTIRINGQKPEGTTEWMIIYNYVKHQKDIRTFIAKWNHIGKELFLPNILFVFGGSCNDILSIHEKICTSRQFIETKWDIISSELKALFPYGINVDSLLHDTSEAQAAIEAIQINISNARLGLQRLKLQDINNKIKNTEGEISIKIKDFLLNTIGHNDYSINEVMNSWQNFTNEIHRINEIRGDLQIVTNIADLISESGAPKWAAMLKNTPISNCNDDLTPDTWYESWQWKRKFQYICEIDSRVILSELSQKREQYDSELKRAFSALVCIKTKIGLHLNMTELVQGALMRFVSAVSKIGKGIGKRAPRHKRDAYNAMQDCHGGVPCWIMPTWRISESLPSNFGLFDLVIIDEASQSDITSIPAILRAKKILVVGDDKQVSPTPIGIPEEKMLQLRRFLKVQTYPELFLPGVSLYDLACVLYPTTRITLLEHFRCVEPIIRFSMQFYSESLIPLRIPKLSERISPPLVDVYVRNGKREGDINELEAEGIIAEIRNITDDPKLQNRSIGIISLIGFKQAKYIQELLLNQLGEEVFEKHNISCGDAAAFQGKERDIIFLSMVVGSEQGIALNKVENQQRFNVALSRARDRMYLFRSIEESELGNESDLRLKVLRHFSNPMPPRKNIDNPIELCHSEFEISVLKRLISMNYNVTPQVKVGAYSIDLVVEGENDLRLAIELDGDQYHTPDKWKEDWQRQRVMERIGWKFWRCWGSSYAIDPNGCINELVEVLNRMHIYPCNSTNLNSVYSEYRVYESQAELNNDGTDLTNDCNLIKGESINYESLPMRNFEEAG